MNRSSIVILSICLLIGVTGMASGADYHFDSKAGDDGRDGLSALTAWKTLQKARAVKFKAGDRILLKRGSVFSGNIVMKGVTGEKSAPVIIDAYGEGKDLPKIDAAGYVAAVDIEDAEHISLSNLEITSDGGEVIEKEAKVVRFGVNILKSSHVSLKELYIHDVFATIQTKSEGKDRTTAYGQGVQIRSCQNVIVAKCVIEKVGRYGIVAGRNSHNLKFLQNKTDHTGGSGIPMSFCRDVVIRGNRIDHPGSFIDERMQGRGSGSWVFLCKDILYERNEFLNANGKADSCGVHIDSKNRNVVIQYCFSMDNAGGFIEILGHNHNCSYRYNISVNDGFRVKRKAGAIQHGKVLWLSGFGGDSPAGPFNSYIYNNTVYVKEGQRSCFSVEENTKGVLIANNIFHVLSPTVNVTDGPKQEKKQPRDHVVFANNVYITDSVLPPSLHIQDSKPIIGDAKFKNPGGTKPEDYIPANAGLLKDKGLVIEKIPGDQKGISIGLDVNEDYFGNPINGTPDIGAVEFSK